VNLLRIPFEQSPTPSLNIEVKAVKKAFFNQEFFLEYQPIIDLMTDSCIGIEALVRWQHPHLGVLLPVDFLPQIKEANMVQALDQWVIQQAFFHYAQLKQSHFFLSINVSVDSFDGRTIISTVLEQLDKYQIQPNQLILELTEIGLVANPAIFMLALQKLSEAGIQIAIDDYGTGYSSLSYLKLPVSMLKIDQSFIFSIEQGLKDKKIIEGTIKLAHSLGLKVIAEGIETKEERLFLQTHGCDCGQGFYFSPSLSLERLKIYLSEQRGM